MGIDVPKSSRRSSTRMIAGDHLSARVGDGPLRFPLRLLHVGEHDLPAQGRCAEPRRTRPAVLGLRCTRRAQAAAHRRRAAGAARHHDPGLLAVAALALRRSRRTDDHHQRLAAREIRAGARRLRRQAHQRLARHARPGQIPRHHALGRSVEGARRHRRCAGSRHCRQDQRGRARRASTKTNSRALSNGRTATAWTSPSSR